MKRSLILLILFAAMLFTAGCIETQENSTSPQSVQENAVAEAIQLEQINASLQKGPVLIKIGAEWCEACQEMQPILAQLAAEYEGRVAVMTVDIDQSPKLADYFGVSVIPDSFVIEGIENGEYIYMREDGNVSTDRFKARILKLEDKEVFEKVLDLALQKKDARSE